MAMDFFFLFFSTLQIFIWVYLKLFFPCTKVSLERFFKALIFYFLPCFYYTFFSPSFLFFIFKASSLPNISYSLVKEQLTPPTGSWVQLSLPIGLFFKMHLWASVLLLRFGMILLQKYSFKSFAVSALQLFPVIPMENLTASWLTVCSCHCLLIWLLIIIILSFL